MDNSFSKAMDFFTDGFKEISKGIEALAEDITSNIFTEKKEGTRISIKKGSLVLISKGVFVKLCQDVEAELVEKKESESKENKESTE